MDHLVEIELAAIAAQTDGNYAEAISKWNALIERNPLWETGTPYYCLATCHSAVGRLPEAEEAYRRAIEIDPGNEMFIDGLASFLEARRKGYL